MESKPFAPTRAELKEIAAVKDLQGLWGADDSEQMEEFLQSCYMAKFKFTNESPGYVGDLFLIQPGELAEEIPITRLYRNRKRKLVVFEDRGNELE